MTSPEDGSLALESVQRIERGGDSSLEHGWTYLQGVLDEALAAVQGARVRNAQMNSSIERFKTRVSELEEHCASLQLRLEESESHAAAVEDTLDQLRCEHDEIVQKTTESVMASPAVTDLSKYVHKIEGRLRRIMDAIERLDRSTFDIENHYGTDVDALAARAEEVNFARDEAIQRIRRAVQGLYNRPEAKPESATPLHATPEMTPGTPNGTSPTRQ